MILSLLSLFLFLWCCDQKSPCRRNRFPHMTIGGLSGKEFNLPLHDCVLLVSRMARPVIQRLMKSSKIPAKV